MVGVEGHMREKGKNIKSRTMGDNHLHPSSCGLGHEDMQDSLFSPFFVKFVRRDQDIIGQSV